jgi:hypothetical protein
MTALAESKPDLPPENLRTVVLSFTGRFTEENGVTFAICDHAAIETHGPDPDTALAHMPGAIRVYVRKLIERDETTAAMRTGILMPRLAQGDPDEWKTPHVRNLGATFIVEMARF